MHPFVLASTVAGRAIANEISDVIGPDCGLIRSSAHIVIIGLSKGLINAAVAEPLVHIQLHIRLY